MKKLLLIFLGIGICIPALAQDRKNKDSILKNQEVYNYPVKTKQDSVTKEEKHIKQSEDSQKDSTFYKKINKYSQKSKVTQWLHKWIFRSFSSSSHSSKTKSFQPDYTPFEGKVVRSISIRSTDPFGYSIDDTTRKPHNWLEKFGNTFHVKSKRMAIKKYLLFKKNHPLDTVLVFESARLLREQPYVRKVKIIPKEIKGVEDSLDIVVRILDSWSLVGDGGLDASHAKVRIRERNFIGMGHQLELDYAKRFKDGSDGYGAVYTVPNINNSFIDLTAKYEVDYDGFSDQFVYLNRDFYSPLTRWAGGILLQKRSLQSEMPTDTVTFVKRPFAYNYQDYWGGYAFHLFNGDTPEDRMSNLVVGLRMGMLHYKNTPTEYDSLGYFSDEQLYMANIGLNSRRYLRDRYIFRDGDIEDIPVGAVYAITAGLQTKNNQNRFYLGARVAYGDYFNWGFLGYDLEAGSFYNQGHPEQTTISFTLNYFSHLLKLGGKWKVRQFVKPRFVLGFNRLNSLIDRVELNDKNYFKGINSYHYVDYLSKKKYKDYENGSLFGFESPVIGTRKYVLDLQTQFYSPWSLWGFRLNPYFRCGLGYLSGGENTKAENKLYSSIGIGVIIRNDYLVFGSFQFSFSYYPSMPGKGYNVIKTNNISSGDYGFQNFELGEPKPVIYE